LQRQGAERVRDVTQSAKRVTFSNRSTHDAMMQRLGPAIMGGHPQTAWAITATGE
jgi:hypothetical protein